ncbi:hypothetical protein DdX_14684 [Ditylenchus destructor]|uniref:Uncharacterized protein n=1 Tax=Ditylenchus destructor TaxID=166010 RepID=A0AAD4R1N4_9BILA|nr:hypothetical protein DdX_14684 [Ditylenchus destructor]
MVFRLNELIEDHFESHSFIVLSQLCCHTTAGVSSLRFFSVCLSACGECYLTASVLCVRDSGNTGQNCITHRRASYLTATLVLLWMMVVHAIMVLGRMAEKHGICGHCGRVEEWQKVVKSFVKPSIKLGARIPDVQSW